MQTVKRHTVTTLVLNSAWIPVDFCCAEDAVSNVLTGTVQVMDAVGVLHGPVWFNFRKDLQDGNLEAGYYHAHQPVLRTCNDAWPVPTIVVSKTTHNRRFCKDSALPTITELAQVYDNICQICCHEFSTDDLTVEHVIPKKAGGTRHFYIVLPTCAPCNSHKADTYPYWDYDGVRLDDKIRLRPKTWISKKMPKRIREEWKPFVFSR